MPSPKIIFPTGTKAPDADLLDGLDSAVFSQIGGASADINSEQQLSCSQLRVQATTSTKRFSIEYNETEDSLDFIYSPS